MTTPYEETPPFAAPPQKDDPDQVELRRAAFVWDPVIAKPKRKGAPGKKKVEAKQRPDGR